VTEFISTPDGETEASANKVSLTSARAHAQQKRYPALGLLHNVMDRAVNATVTGLLIASGSAIGKESSK